MLIWTQVGERVENVRKERKLSRAQFGRLIGVSGQYVGMIERGLNRLSVELVGRICQKTGISADYILFGVINTELKSVSITDIDGLSHEQIQVALDVIKKVAQFINTENGNEVLIQEVVSQLRTNDVNYLKKDE